MRKRIPSSFRYFGVLALAVGWLTIIGSAALNPWFSLTRNALSDLGAMGVENAWMFNLGITVAGILATLYSTYLIWISRSRLEVLASSILLFSALHLILIGVFPEGTYPHLLVSFEFFILMGFSILAFGAALISLGEMRLGLAFTSLSTMGFVGAAFIPWPSIGFLEVFAITLISVWVLMMLRRY